VAVLKAGRLTGKRPNTRQLRDESFRLTLEVGRLAGEVATLGQLYEDLALLVETYVKPKETAE